MEEDNILNIALGDQGNFKVLTDIVIYLDGNEGTNFSGALSGPGPLTVFAPTNGAFGALAVTLGFDGDPADADAVAGFLVGVATVSPQVVIDILNYHVLGGAQDAAALDGLTEVQTVGGEFIDLSNFDPSGGSTELGDLVLGIENPSVIIPNVSATNGIVHVIDKVLLPSGVIPSIVETVISNPDFRILLDVVLYLDDPAVENAGLAGALGAAGADLTVFAPTNAAFVKLAQDLGFDGAVADIDNLTDEEIEDVAGFFTNTDNVPSELLLSVVQYHVSPGTQNGDAIASDADGEIETLLADTTIDVSGFPVLADKETDLEDPQVAIANVPASNGIIHGIDRVLIPADIVPTPLNVVEKVIELSGAEGFDDNGGDFDFLREAVIAADLDGPLSTLDVTVFAPTDDAFMGVSKALGYEGDDEAGGFGYLVDALRLLNAGNDPIELLSTVLTYHVSAGGKTLTEVAAASPVDTLQGGTITVNGTALQDADPDIPDPELVLTDLLVSNGVIHAIDGVLLPVDILVSDGSNDVDFIIGDDGRNWYNTGADNDYIDARGGRDFIHSGDGNDVVLAGAGRDYVLAGKGNDIVKGEAGADKILGGAGDDTIDGGAGRDWISGGWGDDIIAGGAGNDWMSGGFGADTFVFEEGGGRDTIAWFVKGQDKIDLTAYEFEDYDELKDSVDKGFFRTKIDLGDTEITVNTFFGLSESDFIL